MDTYFITISFFYYLADSALFKLGGIKMFTNICMIYFFNKCKGYKKPGLKINQVKFYKLQINM